MVTKILALTALSLLTSSSALAAAGGCHAIGGTHVSLKVPCVVPALVCVESQFLTGPLEGTGSTLITGFNQLRKSLPG
jgi:hypothetical protein